MGLFKVKKSNRKWQGRRQLYKGRFYQLKRLAKGLLLLAVVAGFFSLYFYLKNSEALLIQHVEVLGDHKHLTRDDVVVLSELTPKDHLLTVSLNQVRQNILTHPWVKDVRLNQKFPDTLQIHVTEREPLALLHLDQMYLIDQKGLIFTKATPQDYKDLIVLTGFKKKDFKKFPNLTRRQFAKTIQLLSELNEQNFYKDDPISEIHFDEILGWTVFTKRFGYEVFYGQKKLAEKHEKLEKFYRSEYYQKIDALRLDLDGNQRIIARLRESNDTVKK